MVSDGAFINHKIVSEVQKTQIFQYNLLTKLIII